ncbi:MAG: CCA tRNA nucleotidyltransferase [Elusimicrobia bacterium]|nr:CCA tRNA nucleotidyltransferase [Elusimicrobiota bacterium]
MRRRTKDLDIVLETDPAPLAKACAERLGTAPDSFDRFGTCRVVGPGGLRLDFVRARSESYGAPAALPVVRPGTLLEDLARRDFSINAMAAALTPSGLAELIDPLGGLKDIQRRRVRILHAASFRDDPTRLFRAARFSCRFGFPLDAETDRLRREAVAAGLPALLSRERLRGELWRMLEEKEPCCPLRTARRWRLAELWAKGFAWPADLGEARDPIERLALIALRLGPRKGGELVRSLHLERGQAQAALAALETARRRAAPREALPAAAAAALRRALKPPRKALEPLLLHGGDLKACGLEPGPSYSKWLERAARAQWTGAFADRAAALRWLRSALGV